MTKAMSTRTFVALFAAVALALPVHSAEGPKATPQTYVILVGVSNYADKQIKPRPMAENDAKALYDLFTDKNYLGVEPENIRLLLGKADEKRLERYLKEHGRTTPRTTVRYAIERFAPAKRLALLRATKP